LFLVAAAAAAADCLEEQNRLYGTFGMGWIQALLILFAIPPRRPQSRRAGGKKAGLGGKKGEEGERSEHV